MRRFNLLICFVLFGGVSIAIAQDETQRPKAPPPTITTVRLTDSGELEIFDCTMRREVRTIVETAVKDGKRVAAERTVVVEVPVWRIRRFQKSDATIYDIDGNQYEWDDVAEMLAKPTPVLLSRGAKKVDRFYRKLFMMGTLVLVMPEKPTADLIAPPPAPALPR